MNDSGLVNWIKLQLKENTTEMLIVPYYLLVMVMSLDYILREYVNLL